jgi:hypothetical protein
MKKVLSAQASARHSNTPQSRKAAKPQSRKAAKPQSRKIVILFRNRNRNNFV